MATYGAAGLIEPVDTGYYSPQHMAHSSTPLLVDFVLRYSHEIDEAHAGTGDVVLYRFGRSFSHAAIVVEWPREIIHAHKLSGKVVAMRGDVADLGGRPTRFFSFWG